MSKILTLLRNNPVGLSLAVILFTFTCTGAFSGTGTAERLKHIFSNQHDGTITFSLGDTIVSDFATGRNSAAASGTVSNVQVYTRFHH